MVVGVGDMCICLNTHMVILVVAEDYNDPQKLDHKLR